ncbi:MAG TPA: hypothetical protein VI730_07305 [Burkholderiales bacterium]|nr:hypothetical protein [Burkholderiales bacterium]
MKRALYILAAAAVVGLAGCGESEQVIVYKQGKYQGKPDTRPWDNEPLAAGPKWNKGDRTSWETQIKQRQLGQHEHRRIYQ